MPEITKVTIYASEIKNFCIGEEFESVEINKSTKNQSINIPYKKFSLDAQSRGKELLLIIQNLQPETSSESTQIFIVFSFGMSGKVLCCPAKEKPKSVQMVFTSKTQKTVCFIKSSWKIGKWSANRGPDPINEFKAFQDNVLNNLDKKVFESPICELLLNQQYFNGIGNYLRAEILFRAKIPPFMVARDALQMEKEPQSKLLALCKDVPSEVITFYHKEPKNFYINFRAWKKAYRAKGSKWKKDSNGRKIYFFGESGLPNEDIEDSKKSGKKPIKEKSKKRARESDDDDDSNEEDDSARKTKKQKK